jgi:transcriptional regulator with XRE-family HTH domain
MNSKQFYKWREAMGLSAKEAADYFGYSSPSTIWQFEHDKAQISHRVSLICELSLKLKQLEEVIEGFKEEPNVD